MSKNGTHKLKGQTALIVEDQPIIAMDLEQLLNDAGVQVLAAVASTRDALEFLELHSPHFAVLDVNLGEETCEPIARLMLERRMPFVFTTGYDDAQTIMPAEFSAIPVVHKPFQLRAVTDALCAILDPPRHGRSDAITVRMSRPQRAASLLLGHEF